MKKQTRIFIACIIAILVILNIITLYFLCTIDRSPLVLIGQEDIAQFYRDEVIAYIDDLIKSTPEDSTDGITYSNNRPIGISIKSIASLKQLRGYIMNTTTIQDVTNADISESEIPAVSIFGKSTGDYRRFIYNDIKHKKLIILHYNIDDKIEFFYYINSIIENNK